MSVRDEFDAWADRGRDRGMEERHWRTVKRVLARMPVEAGDVVLDLGTGSGYAARALRATGAGTAVGVDASPRMAARARSYTEDARVGFVLADLERLPVATDIVDHAFSMEAIYYAADPRAALRDVARVIRSGGTFFCAVDYYAENPYSADWQDHIAVDMTRWGCDEYRAAFRAAGFHVAEQDNVPDLDIEIPAADAFPYDGWDTREAMVERYRELGTLLTVGVIP